MQTSYWRFGAMIATSTVVMFGLMYLNSYSLDHVLWSQTRAWMAVLMGATMAIIMLGYMLGMYKNRKLNIAVFTGSAIVFAACLWLVRSQATVNGLDYMKAMVPHHSIAVLTSSRARITDPRVRKLADEIIAAQRREIAEMKYLIEQLEAGGGQVDALHEAATQPRVVPAREAITTASIAMTDLGELDEAEIERVLGRGPRCGFSYSRDAGPVLAASMTTDASGVGQGLIKLHGLLVEVTSRPTAAIQSSAGGITVSAEGLQVLVEPKAGGAGSAQGSSVREATARLHLDAGLSVGYSGFYQCDSGDGLDR